MVYMSNAMELVSKDGQEDHLGVECPQYMFSQVIEIPHRTVLLNLVEDIGAKGSPIFTSIPCGSLHFKANEHVIEIPPRTVLLKVMEAIGARTEPIFMCTPCESSHFKVCVELDVSGARFSIEMEKIQDEYRKYNGNPTKKLDNFLGEVHFLQSVWFSERDVLDYVLSYLGIGKAEYNSILSDGGKVEGNTMFSFPCIVEGRFHKLEFHSRAITSSRAQEVAARAALLFMESNLNVKIVDVNYADRQLVEKKHRFLELIKDRFLQVAHQLKTQLANMVECIAGWCAVYSGDARLVFGGPMSQEQMMAVEFCSKSLEVVRADCATCYESSVSMFQEMEKLCGRLESL